MSSNTFFAGLAAALMTVALPTGAAAHQTHSHAHTHGHGHQQVAVQRLTVIVSCYRGPWEDVIWDRPNPEFIDSMVAVGYTFPEAHAIGERVCRDRSLVGNEAGLQATMSQILATNPPGSR